MNVNVNVAELVLHMKMMDYAMDVQNANIWKNKPTDDQLKCYENIPTIWGVIGAINSIANY